MNTMPVALDITSPKSIGDFTSYLQFIRTIPLLCEKEERELFEKYQNDNDLNAAKRIIMAHLGFVVGIAKGFKGYGLPMEDLVQEGNIGLMKSVKRFDLSFGYRLSSFASHYIKAEIHEYILANWRLVKVATTKAKRKLFFKLNKLKKRLSWLSNAEAKDIAQELDVDIDEVHDMEARLQRNDAFFDETFGDRIEEDATSYSASSGVLADNSTSPDVIVENQQVEKTQNAAMWKALSVLDPRSRDVIERRWLFANGHKANLQQLADEYNVSAERIRQIEARALKVMRENMHPV
jgi:RNA polymerase sigma-32 factor